MLKEILKKVAKKVEKKEAPKVEETKYDPSIPENKQRWLR